MKTKIIVSTGLIVTSLFTSASAELISGTDLSINFESANIIGSGRNINMHRVPVTNINTGETTFYDVSFKFTFSNDSGLLFEQISSASISPALSASNLIPGKYLGENSSTITYELSEPSILEGGRLFYTLKRSGSGGFSAQIVSGNATNHPDIGSREITNDLSPTYIYGIVTTAAGCCTSSFIGNGDKWNVNHLIGVRQTGSSLSVTLFSQGEDSNGKPQDFNSQREGAVLTRIIE